MVCIILHPIADMHPNHTRLSWRMNLDFASNDTLAEEPSTEEIVAVPAARQSAVSAQQLVAQQSRKHHSTATSRSRLIVAPKNLRCGTVRDDRRGLVFADKMDKVRES